MKKIIFKIFILTFFFLISFSVSSAECLPLRYSLQSGSTDASTQGEVSRLQAFLNSIRVLEVSPTGYFGALTKQAVQRFQAVKGISTLGIVGPQTRSAIYSVSCTLSSQSGSNTSGGARVGVPVTFYSFNKNSTIPVPIGLALKLPALSTNLQYPDYSFYGWYLDPGFKNVYTSQIISTTTTLFALWKKVCGDGTQINYPGTCSSTSNNSIPATTNTSQSTIQGNTQASSGSDIIECTYGGYTYSVPSYIGCN